MNKLQLPQSKLLYAVAEAYRKRMIDQNEKRILKQKIITDNVEIFQALDQNDNQSALFERLISLVREEEGETEEVQPVEDHDIQVPNPVQQEEASSPWGQFLRKKKAKTQHNSKKQTHGIKNLIRPLDKQQE